MVCKDVGRGPLYFCIVGGYPLGLFDVEDFGGDVLIIIKCLCQVGVLGGGGVGGIRLEFLPRVGERGVIVWGGCHIGRVVGGCHRVVHHAA